jgi:flagellar protein FlgJ
MDFTAEKSNSTERFFSIRNSNAGYSVRSRETAPFYSLRDTDKSFSLRFDAGRGYALEKKAFHLDNTGTEKNTEAERIRLRQAAEGFEAIFIRQFLKTMSATLAGGSLFGGGTAGEIYADMAETALADVMAKEGRFGIADTLYRRLAGTLHLETPSSENTSSENIPQAGGRK